MQVIVRARDMDLTPALTAHAESKLGTALTRIFDRPAAKIDIELCSMRHAQSGNNQECRVTVFIPKGKSVTIFERDDDMYKAIDLAHDRVLMQVKRSRDRIRRSSRTRKMAEAQRAMTARRNLSAEPETWEREVREYERSLIRA